MWCVVKYLNKKQNILFQITNICMSFKDANSIAKSLADKEFGRFTVEGVEIENVYIEAEYKYTLEDGYNNNVYAVINIPKIEY
jgi:hypothetical protein